MGADHRGGCPTDPRSHFWHRVGPLPAHRRLAWRRHPTCIRELAPRSLHPISNREVPMKKRRLPEEAGIFAALVVLVLFLTIFSRSFRPLPNAFDLLVN